MLIATFGPTTGWHGKHITHDGWSFVLEGHGVITARDVLDYDRQGQIEWANAGLREWVERLAQRPPGAIQPGSTASPRGQALPAQQPARSGVAGFVLALAGFLLPVLWIVGLILSWGDVKRARRDNLPHGLAIAGLIISSIGIGILVVGLAAAMAIPMYLGQRDKAKESAVKEGVHSIQIGVQSWAVDHGDAYPDPSLVNESGMFDYVDIWPTNPYTDLPMEPGTGPGQYLYERPSDHEFSVTAFGSDGSAIINVP